MKNKQQKAKKKIGYLTKSFIVMATFMVVINIVLGVVLAGMSHFYVKKMSNARMLDIAKIAAASLDGDDLRDLTKEDKNTPAYQQSLAKLRVIQDNIELKYIYCIKKVDEDHFVFSIDPTVADPGEFGSPIVATEALKEAYNGTPSVDGKAYRDDWGRFYSAYAPVFDSQGKVAVVVAIDVDAKQYEWAIWQNTVIVFVISILALSGGGLLVYILTNNLRRRFNTLYTNLSSLGDNIEELNEQIVSRKNPQANVVLKEEAEVEAANSQDVIGRLNGKIDVMQKELAHYMDHIYEMAYTDGMTGVKNKTAYFEKIRDIDERIQEGTADFSVAVFDINSLKKMNDNHGHRHGDRVIVDSVKIMSEVFGIENVYRIGGDEFIAIMEKTTAEEMKDYFRKVDERLEKFNAFERTYETPIGFSKGSATFDKDRDVAYKSVFKAADENMYADKQTYYLDSCVVYAASKQTVEKKSEKNKKSE